MAKRSNPFTHYVQDFEKEAESFLRKYGCEDAIDTPMPIPIREIATKLMSLEIIDTEYLSDSGIVHGAITFTGGIIDVFDFESGQMAGYAVDFPTIFIDADIQNLGRINNTIAHECYHWWRHRNYFNYKRIYEHGVEFAFRCDNSSAYTNNSKSAHWSEEEKMEWQARKIAPKILMPRQAFCKKVEAIYRELLSGKDGYTRQFVTEKVIETVADFFQVSKLSAAIRMVELGYSEAKEYCGNMEIIRTVGQPEQRQSTARKHHQPVSLEQAFELYRINDLLRSILDTGRFCFVDGYFILDDCKYLTSDVHGQKTLTAYARSHRAECVLDFSEKLVPEKVIQGNHSVMYRADSVFQKETSFDSNTQNTELLNKAKDFEKKFERARKTAKTPAMWMKERMEEENWHEYTFEEKTGLDKMNFSRVQKGNHSFSMRPLIAMGVGLGLNLSEMEEVLRLGGMMFKPGDREQEAYKYLFSGLYGRDIDFCNDFLASIGVTLLGTQQKF